MTVNCYETILIFDDRLTEANYNTMIEYFLSFLTEDLASAIKGIDKLGKKKLAYPIKIKGTSYEATEGWYVIFTYKTSPDNIAKIETKIKEDERVIKFLSIRREDDDLEEYAEVDTGEELYSDHLAESESEQNPSGIKPETDCWNMIFNFEEVS